MSQDYDQHIILHHLDDPLRIFHWTLDEAFAVMTPALFGLIIEYPIHGVIGSAVCYWGLKKVKKTLGFETLKHAMYWYLPKSDKKLPNTPPSHVREYIG